MGSSVYLKLKNGRTVSLLTDADKAKADAMKSELDKWVQRGQTLSVTHASGTVEDVTPHGVHVIEVVETPSGRSDLDLV
ncbi:MAG TPA: hypothetical protein VHX44_10920 [Planctomycetota bacterium]|nr:hypothetical protein [Planctomycetota bacterium]